MSERDRKLIDSVILTSGQIRDRCDRLAEQIFDDYKGKELNMLVILTGANQFFNDLNTSLRKVRTARNPKSDEEDVILKYFFVKATSYTNTTSSGTVTVTVPEEVVFV